MERGVLTGRPAHGERGSRADASGAAREPIVRTRLAPYVALAAIVMATLGIAGCAGCEDSVCCAVPGHAIDRITRPSQCTSMGGTAVSLSRCEVVCCRAADGSVGPLARSECSMVVDPAMCDGADAGP